MFRPVAAVSALLFCFALIVFSSTALPAAAEGLQLWWQSVLPALFPFFVGVRLIERSGFLARAAKMLSGFSRKLRLSPYAIPVALLSALAGYPCGARLSAMLLQQGCLDQKQASRLGTVCNLCSPMFLLGTLSCHLFGTPSFFPILALSHYLGALITALSQRFFFPDSKEASACAVYRIQPLPLFRALPDAIGEGMTGMLQVGGCIVFFTVLTRLVFSTGLIASVGAWLDSLFPGHTFSCDLLQAFLSGILEMTTGCCQLSRLGLPPRLLLPLCTFFVSFGGVCVMIQAFSFLQIQTPLRFLSYKLTQGAISGMLAYVLTPLFSEPAQQVLAIQTDPIGIYSAGTVLLCGLLAVTTALLFGIVGSGVVRLIAKRTSAAGRRFSH